MKMLCLLLIILSGSAYAQQASQRDRDPKNKVPFYNYHTSPPFIIEKDTGLIYDLGTYLAHKLVNEAIVVEDLPRKRLDLKINEAAFMGAVLLVSPSWFNDSEMTTFNWTEPVFIEEDVIVSAADKKVDYSSPDSLKGKTIGIVLGYQYPMFDELIEAGSIKRVDTRDEKSGLNMLVLNRFNALVLSRSSVNYLSHEMVIADKLFVSKIPVNRYERRILVSKKNRHLKEALDSVISRMKTDPEWKRILAKYGLDESR